MDGRCVRYLRDVNLSPRQPYPNPSHSHTPIHTHTTRYEYFFLSSHLPHRVFMHKRLLSTIRMGPKCNADTVRHFPGNQNLNITTSVFNVVIATRWDDYQSKFESFFYDSVGMERRGRIDFELTDH